MDSCTVLTCLSGSEDLSSSSTMVPGEYVHLVGLKMGKGGFCICCCFSNLGPLDPSSACAFAAGPAKGFTTITIPGQRMPASDDKLAWDTNDFSLLLLFPEDSVVDTAKGTVTYPAGRGFQLLDSRQVEYHHQQLLIASQP